MNDFQKTYNALAYELDKIKEYQTRLPEILKQFNEDIPLIKQDLLASMYSFSVLDVREASRELDQIEDAIREVRKYETI